MFFSRLSRLMEKKTHQENEAVRRLKKGDRIPKPIYFEPSHDQIAERKKLAGILSLELDRNRIALKIMR
ncbi:hypothetical protein B9Z55_025135 [Caenorhabditis nigoni]|uniref:Uncharacterized protein n=1 Tax=Caenorhabditis nigoni TaxID=1611254 RepID=A0A2G5SXF0_9PELO|nr:hypothetical protein B9Z55_025135 [Caenorhabditis nigoni]